jgi:CheY-like chemotaxis protein
MTFQILLVEDSTRQFESLAGELKVDGWEVTRARDKDDALFQLRTLEEKGVFVDAAAIDLGLPPYPDDIFVGLDLIKRIRANEKFSELPILAYSAMANPDFHASLVRRLLTMRVSFLYLRPLDFSFANLMNYIRQDFFLLSPRSIGYLVNAVPTSHDPLEDDHWATLEELSKNLTHAEIAENLNIAVDTVRSRLDKARQRLIDQGEIPVDARNEDMTQWYREHVVRYARDPDPKPIPRSRRKNTEAG